MKQVCLTCARSAADSNLYCQEVACPAEKSPLILEHGEWLADVEIVKPVIVLRTATVYEATQHNRRVYLKVAHRGNDHVERLKREAALLAELKKTRQLSPYLPEILPPYTGANYPSGEVMLQNQLLHFFIFSYIPGEALRDVLARRPQPWIFHIGWIVINLSDTIALLQSKGVCHLALTPDAILVNFDDQSGSLRLLLVDLGLVASYEQVSLWYRSITYPAYSVPELIKVPPTADYSSDVYGLGLILYELLIGQPAYPARLLDDTAVYQVVSSGNRIAMNRGEDVEAVAKIAEKAVELEPSNRYPNAQVLNEELNKFFGKVPGIKKNWWPELHQLVWAGLILLTITFAIVLYITTRSLFP